MTFQAPPSEQPRGDSTGVFPYYINWHAQGSADNGIGAACFSIREAGAGNSPTPSEYMIAGTVWDIDNIETGWQSWPKGGTKEYRANQTLATPLPYPGAGWGEAIKIPMALDANTAACWDQASAGSWKGFCQIAAVIAQQAPANPGLLPVIKLVGATLTSTGQNSTQVPNFEIMKWVPRPACLLAEDFPVSAAPAPVVSVPVTPAPPVAPQGAPAPVAPVGAWN